MLLFFILPSLTHPIKHVFLLSTFNVHPLPLRYKINKTKKKAKITHLLFFHYRELCVLLWFLFKQI